MPLETLFKPQHKLRGAETLKMENESKGNGQQGFRLPNWFWPLVVSLICQVIGAAFVTGQVTAKLDAVSYRVQRIETQMDRYFVGVKP